MSEQPAGRVLADPVWGDFLSNRLLVLAALVLFLFALPDLVRLLPSLLDCCLRSKSCTDLEHSVNRARQRNGCANLLILPFSLLVSRYQLYAPSLITENIPPQWNAPVILGVTLLYLLLRLLVFKLVCPSSGGENARAAHHAGSNIFIVGFILVFLSAGILSFAGLADGVVKTVLLWETALFFLLTLIRCGQILRQICDGFSTILYLCALEIAPAAVIVCSAILF